MKIPKKWNIKALDEKLVSEIAQGLKVSLPVAKVLVSRGIASLREAELFVDPGKGELHNPFLLPDMAAAVKRIRKAVDSGEKILVYGDRDVDGITSICIMVRTLKSIGVEAFWYIPSDEGYWLNNEVIDRYAKQGVRLIITVDCGISAADNIEFAKTLGIDSVVTDHHEQAPTGLPAAVAVVDAKRADSKYPFIDLAGCAVSFKVCEALMQSFGKYYGSDIVGLGAGELDSSGARDICVLVSRNGIVVDRKSYKFGDANRAADEKQSLSDFYNSCEGAVVICRGDDNPVGWVNGVLRASGLSELKNRVIDADQYAADQFGGGAVDCRNEARAPGAAPAEEKASSALQYFLCVEAANDLRMKFFRESNMDAVALGTIADIMPLVGENRIFVNRGLKQLAVTQKAGLRMLIEKCARNMKPGALNAKTVSWSITPVLNAAGRRGKAILSAELLLTDDPRRAEKLIGEILQLNAERKELQAENLEKFLPVLKSQCDLVNDKIFVVTASGIEHGVTGIIASQIMRQYRRPTVLLIVEGEEAMGAARSFEGFDILGAISRLSDILVKFGGHTQAAGLTVPAAKIDEFRSRLKAIAEAEISPEALVPSLDIDAELDPADVVPGLIDELSRLEPFGMGNPHPVFTLRDMKIRELSRMGAGGDHLKLKISKNGSPALGAVGWGLGSMEDEIMPQAFVDLAFQLELNTWQDRSSVQLVIEDIKPSGVQ